MEIRKVAEAPKEYFDWLLLADKWKNMIDKYLELGEMFFLDDNDVKAECVFTKETDDIYELKNIDVMPD